MKPLTIKYRLNNLLLKWVRIPLLVLSVCVINSCNNYPDPSIETLVNYNVSYMNPNPVSIGGEYMKDSIYIQIYNYKSPQDISGFTVEFKVQKGGGSVDQQQVKTRKDGKAATRWKLGTDSFTQIITTRVTDPDGNVLPESQIIAHGILYNAWNEIDYSPLNQLSGMASDTITQQSWMISVGRIYKLETNFLDWQSLSTQPINSPRQIEIDKNGIIYVGTWNGELYKSTNHGQTWIKCTNPIPDRPYYFDLWITNDDDLWATVYGNGLWHSKDGGLTWSNPANGADKSTSISGMYRLKNNWIVSLISPTGQGMSVMKSEDEGKTWTALITPNYPYSLFVTKNDVIIVLTQTDGGIYKSTDLGKTYNRVYSASVAFNTGSPQSYVQKFGPDYYIIIPGYGVLKTKDFDHFETLLTEAYVNGLYLDHTGSVYAKGTLNKLYSTFIYNQK